MKAIVQILTGEFRDKQGNFECGHFEPQRPVLSVSPEGVTTFDPDYAVVEVDRMPDPRTEKWNGSAIVPQTAADMRPRLLNELRIERTKRLRDSDWTQIPDAALTADIKAAWRTYRQALRDLPATVADPAQLVWPVEPPA